MSSDTQPMQARSWLSSLRVTFAFVLAAMVAGTALGLILVTSVNARSTTLTVARSMVGQITDTVHERVTAWLDEPRFVTHAIVRDLRNGMVSLDDDARVDVWLFDTLHGHPDLQQASVARPNGDFHMLKRGPDGAVSTKRIRHSPEGARSVQWTWRAVGDDPKAVLRVEETPEDTYDPRTRPWFKGASGEGAFWSEVYVFWTDRTPGITVSRPIVVNDERVGVTSVDVSLAAFSQFLAELHVGERGSVAIIDTAGHVIASPDPADLVQEIVEEGGNKLALREATQSRRPGLAALAALPAFSEALHSGDDRLTVTNYTSEGERWIAAIRPVQVTEGRFWRIAVFAPEDDFLGEVHRLNRNNLLLALVFCAVALAVSLVLARWLSGSLHILVTESRRIQRLEFDHPVEGEPRFREVNDVLVAFEGMKTGLRAFHKYIPTELVRILLESRQEPELGSELKQVTLWFSDIAGFTTVSERLGPQQMAISLGHYLSGLSDVITAQQGTVVQYVGDQIFAFWNAPLPVDDHAARAAEAVLRCLDVVNEIWNGEDGAPPFPTRFALHTTEVAVGHFGSPDRLYYGAVGDGVNLCSRLEGANKLYDTYVIVSGDTVAAIRGRFEVRWLDRVVVKGRVAALDIYELLGRAGEVSPERMAFASTYEDALRSLVSRDFHGALDRLAALDAQRPGDASVALLRERAAAFLAQPPPADWDGAFHLLHK